MTGEELRHETDYSGFKLTERENTIKGSDAEALRARAEGLRCAPFQTQWSVLRLKNNLAQLSPESRLLAMECAEQFYEEVDDRAER